MKISYQRPSVSVSVPLNHTPLFLTETQGGGSKGVAESPGTVAPPPPSAEEGEVAADRDGDADEKRIFVYVLAGVAGILVSYLASGTYCNRRPCVFFCCISYRLLCCVLVVFVCFCFRFEQVFLFYVCLVLIFFPRLALPSYSCLCVRFFCFILFMYFSPCFGCRSLLRTILFFRLRVFLFSSQSKILATYMLLLYPGDVLGGSDSWMFSIRGGFIVYDTNHQIISYSRSHAC